MSILRPRSRGLFRRVLSDHRATATMEMALAFPVMFALVFGIFQSGRVLWLQNLLTYSVAEAARCATINQTACGTASQIQSYASSESGNNFASSVFSVTTPSCGNQVSATYPVAFSILNFAVPLTLTASACYPA